MPAIDVFWLNHSMTFLPNKPPQLTVATRGHRPPLAQWPEDAGFTLPEDTSPPQTSYRLDNRDCGGAAKNSGENRVVVSPRKTASRESAVNSRRTAFISTLLLSDARKRNVTVEYHSPPVPAD